MTVFIIIVAACLQSPQEVGKPGVKHAHGINVEVSFSLFKTQLITWLSDFDSSQRKKSGGNTENFPLLKESRHKTTQILTISS